MVLEHIKCNMKIWAPPIVKRRRWILCLLVLAASVNIYLYYIISDGTVPKDRSNQRDQLDATDASKLTVLIREFEHFHNLLQETTQNVLLHASRVVVISDSMIYPPVKLPVSVNMKLIVLNSFPEHQNTERSLEKVIVGEHILILPDGVKVIAPVVNEALEMLNAQKNIKIIAIPVKGHKSACTTLNFQYKEWTLKYLTSDKICNSVIGKHAILMSTKDFLSLGNPVTRPMEDALYIQSNFLQWNVLLLNSTFPVLGNLFDSPHLKWKQDVFRFGRIKDLYKDFGIKLLQQHDGTETWFGCDKTSSRCFGTIINDMPDYLYTGRWTPPCCLRNLRTTARHVFKILEAEGVRYWLEGGSLLGAARNMNIIPWDYDIDIGVYKSDISKSTCLSKCKSRPYEDEDGFVWEKGTEGNFCRVQFSHSNHLHVDIFPFYSKNGIMTKDTWFKNHRQDREFPEHYLQPRTKIKFIGIDAYAPNNVKDFLEYKFGQGVIEHPKYPDSSNVTGFG